MLSLCHPGSSPSSGSSASPSSNRRVFFKPWHIESFLFVLPSAICFLPRFPIMISTYLPQWSSFSYSVILTHNLLSVSKIQYGKHFTSFLGFSEETCQNSPSTAKWCWCSPHPHYVRLADCPRCFWFRPTGTWTLFRGQGGKIQEPLTFTFLKGDFDGKMNESTTNSLVTNQYTPSLPLAWRVQQVIPHNVSCSTCSTEST